MTMSQRFFQILFLCIAVVFLSVPPALAQSVYLKNDGDQAPNKASEKQLQDIAAAQEKAEQALNDKLMSVIGEASLEERQHFYLLYSNYNIIKATNIIADDVEHAVKACAENNPDMKDELGKRFRDWNKSVGSVLKEAKANVKNMVIAQGYAEPKKIEEVFLMADQIRDLANEKSEKVPVTSESACQYLLKTMDKTQSNLQQTLQQTLISVPKAFQKKSK